MHHWYADGPAISLQNNFLRNFLRFNRWGGYAKISCRNLFAEKLSAELANSESVTFIAYKNGTPLGYLKLNIGNAQTEKCLDNALEIQRIYILKSAKGHGIGSAFMQIAENFASEKKLSTIWFGVWEHNEPAKKFYKSKGYEKFSHHTFVIGDDMQTDFLLKKEILWFGAKQKGQP